MVSKPYTHAPAGLDDWLRFNERKHSPSVTCHDSAPFFCSYHPDLIEWEQPDTVEVVVLEEGDE